MTSLRCWPPRLHFGNLFKESFLLILFPKVFFIFPKRSCIILEQIKFELVAKGPFWFGEVFRMLYNIVYLLHLRILCFPRSSFSYQEILHLGKLVTSDNLLSDVWVSHYTSSFSFGVWRTTYVYYLSVSWLS